MGFSDRLLGLMKEKGVKWKTVSEDLKIGINQKRYWETHENLPDGETLKKLSDYFEVTIPYLIGGTDDRGQKNSPMPSDGTGDMLDKKISLLSETERAQIERQVDELLIKRLSGQ